MKKLILLFVIVFLVSCNRNIIEPLKMEENVFQSNKEKILKMNSSELSAFPISIQILAFENKSSLNKSNLFKNKFSNIIQQNFLSTEKNNFLKYC